MSSPVPAGAALAVGLGLVAIIDGVLVPRVLEARAGSVGQESDARPPEVGAKVEAPSAKVEVAVKVEAPSAKVEVPSAKVEVAAKVEAPSAKVEVPSAKVEVAPAKVESPAKVEPPAKVDSTAALGSREVVIPFELESIALPSSARASL
ncbi:MAG: hypothetical protein JNJ59_15665, partial [Deltaproteobacteria bacterium]|nr:hypothetical protein [Deltaproteobacteria bacterium]